MPIQHRPTVAEIDLEALRSNYREIKKRITEETSILAIVKANAYGHGALICSRVLEGMGISRFGVATLEEGMELRQEGIKSHIFILGGLLTESLQAFIDFRLRPVIHQLDDLQKWGAFLKKQNREHAIHLKIDTGMGRLGFFPSQIDEVVKILKEYPEIQLEGVMTHLARADEENPESTQEQFNLFTQLKKSFQEKGFKIPFYHIANSAAVIDGKLDSYQMVRPGLVLYGAYPHPRHQTAIALKPVMKLKTKIMSLKKYPIGVALGYGGTFVTQRESLIGILPIGYADGYPRLVSNRGSVLVCGKRAPVVGRVSMDLTLIDVTEIPEAQLNDEVVLLGRQKEEQIHAEEVATWAETISYEIFCGVSSRVPRVYVGL